jgi:hypothetical protein
MANLMIHTPSILVASESEKYWNAVSGQRGITNGWYGKGVVGSTFSKYINPVSGVTVGCLFKNDVSTPTLVALSESGTNHCDLRFSAATGKFTVTRNGTLLATGNTVLSPRTEYYVEIQFVISDTVGTAILHIDGVLDTGINATNLDTRNGATGVCNAISFQGLDTEQFKDIYINDNTGGVDDGFWGPISIVTMRPEGAGNKSQWTPSAGSNYQNVDDTTTNSDTDYNATSTNGNIDTYAMSDTGYASGTVLGVEWVADVRKADPSATARVAPVLRIGGTDYVGSDINPTTTYLLQNQRFRLQPVAGTPAWDVATLDAMEVGIKRTAA